MCTSPVGLDAKRVVPYPNKFILGDGASGAFVAPAVIVESTPF
jgi:hypothetical protein